jgi:hypothetical protein
MSGTTISASRPLSGLIYVSPKPASGGNEPPRLGPIEERLCRPMGGAPWINLFALIYKYHSFDCALPPR